MDAFERPDSANRRLIFGDTEFMLDNMDEREADQVGILIHPSGLQLCRSMDTSRSRSDRTSRIVTSTRQEPRHTLHALKGFLRPTDLFLEFSGYPIDLKCARNTFLRAGIPRKDVDEVMPPEENAVPVYRFIRESLHPLLEVNNWKLETIFAVLFPQHRLVGLHHDAMVDTLKLYLVFHVVAQLYRPPQQRRYPQGFFNNLWSHFESLGPRLQVKQKVNTTSQIPRLTNQSVLPLACQPRQASQVTSTGQDLLQQKVTLQPAADARFLDHVQDLGNEATTPSCTTPSSNHANRKGAKARRRIDREKQNVPLTEGTGVSLQIDGKAYNTRSKSRSQHSSNVRPMNALAGVTDTAQSLNHTLSDCKGHPPPGVTRKRTRSQAALSPSKRI